jgi:hypothetical protein
MTAFLPPNLLALFAARDPIQYLPPADKQGFAHHVYTSDYDRVGLNFQNWTYFNIFKIVVSSKQWQL